MPNTYYSILGTDFVWDEDKNRSNMAKHGIDFYTAAMVFKDDLRLEYQDPLHSAEEERYHAIGLVHDILTVVFCDRKNESDGKEYTRIISARLAGKKEIEAYNNNMFGRNRGG